jgi:hypothetical protein
VYITTVAAALGASLRNEKRELCYKIQIIGGRWICSTASVISYVPMHKP